MSKWFFKSIEINGGFLPGFSLSLPAGLTCIIGPRGSGKSTDLLPNSLPAESRENWTFLHPNYLLVSATFPHPNCVARDEER